MLCQHIFDTLLQIKDHVNLDVYCFCSDPNVQQYLPKGVQFIQRDPRLDSDETLGKDIYSSFMSFVDADVYGLIHATSPFIKAASVIKGLNKIIDEDYDSALSCAKVQTFCWFKGVPINYSLTDVVRTQDIEPVLWETSAFYIFKKDVMQLSGRRIGERPFFVETNRIESVDIDEEQDYELANIIASQASG